MKIKEVSLTLRKLLITIFLSFFLVSSILSITYYISDYRKFRSAQTQEIADREFESTLEQVHGFLTQPFLAAENMTWFLKEVTGLKDNQKAILINALGILKTSLAHSLVISWESGESFSAAKKMSNLQAKKDQKEIFETFWVSPKDTSKHIEKTVCDASGNILSVKKYPPIPKEVLDYLEDETKGFSLLDDFRDSEGYQAALRSKTPGWYSPMESDSGEGYFLPLIFPIINENKEFVGTTTLFIPSTQFSELGKKLAAETPFCHICIFDKDGSTVLSSYKEKSIYKSNTQGQWTAKNVWEMGDSFKQAYQEYERKGKPDFLTFTTQGTERNERHIAYFRKLTPYTDWTLALTFKQNILSQSIQKDIKTDLLFLIIKLFIFSGIIFWVLKFISGPVVNASSRLREIAELAVVKYSQKNSFFLEIQELATSLANLGRNTKIFQKLVPKTLVGIFNKTQKEISVGGIRSEITVSFCDNKSFYSLIKSAPAEYVFQYLSNYFDPITELTLHHQGLVDKYMDSILMALFGTPLPLKNHAEMACKAALASLGLAEKSLNPQLKIEDRPPLDLVFGIATGYAISGLAGSSDRLQYSAFGDTVNLASRLKSLNAYYGTQILVNESTYQQTSHLFFFRPVDLVRVHGKQKAVPVYELIAPYDSHLASEESLKEKAWSIQTYMDFILTIQKGWDAYHNRQWKKSIEFYSKALSMKPHDRVSDIFLQRLKEFLTNPPNDSWDGVYNA